MGIQTPKETNHEKKINISNADIEKFWVFFM